MCPADAEIGLEDYILAFAYAPGPEGFARQIRGKTLLQKLLYHLRKNLESVPGSEVPHLYGPFDEQAQVSFEQLETSGYLRVDPASSIIRLTAKGERDAQQIWKKLDPEVRRLIESLKKFMGDLNSEEILAVTYAEYPESAVDSIVRADIEAKGAGIALGLVKRGKVSAELGAKIARMPLREFLRYLSHHKVPVVEQGEWISRN